MPCRRLRKRKCKRSLRSFHERAIVKDKVILVTGAAKRIGRSIALALAAEGARVVIHYNESEREARATAEECGGAPLLQANLENVAEIRAMFDRIAGEFGLLDGLDRKSVV